LPFESEQHYAECVAETIKYRNFLAQQYDQHPELFPAAFSEGYQFHSRYRQKKQDLVLRRIKLKATEKVLTIRPSFVMPYGVGRTDEMEKALFLRRYGVPFDGLAYVFGRDANFWQRSCLQLGRPSLLGTTIKDPERLPADLVADEKVTWLDGEEVYVTTTAAAGCLLGVGWPVTRPPKPSRRATASSNRKRRNSGRLTRRRRSAPTASKRRDWPGGSCFRKWL
jgi:hypothetical protein